MSRKDLKQTLQLLFSCGEVTFDDVCSMFKHNIQPGAGQIATIV